MSCFVCKKEALFCCSCFQINLCKDDLEKHRKENPFHKYEDLRTRLDPIIKSSLIQKLESNILKLRDFKVKFVLEISETIKTLEENANKVLIKINSKISEYEKILKLKSYDEKTKLEITKILDSWLSIKRFNLTDFQKYIKTEFSDDFLIIIQRPELNPQAKNSILAKDTELINDRKSASRTKRKIENHIEIDNFKTRDQNIKSIQKVEELKPILKERESYQIFKDKDLTKSIQEKINDQKSVTGNVFPIELIYVEKNESRTLEKWRFSSQNNQNYVLKILKSSDKDSISQIQQEISIITKYKDSGLFSQITPYNEDMSYGYYSYDFTTLDQILRTRTFDVQEIKNFLVSIGSFMNAVSGSLSCVSIEPSIIGYNNGVFLILDFKYLNSTCNKNYLPPELCSNKDSIRASLSFIYTTGLIVLEMLGESIVGLNTPNMFPLLMNKIHNQNISDNFKKLLSKMLEPDPSRRIERKAYLEEISRIL